MQIPGYDFWKERAVQAKSLAERMRTPSSPQADAIDF